MMGLISNTVLDLLKSFHVIYVLMDVWIVLLKCGLGNATKMHECRRPQLLVPKLILLQSLSNPPKTKPNISKFDAYYCATCLAGDSRRRQLWLTAGDSSAWALCLGSCLGSRLGQASGLYSWVACWAFRLLDFDLGLSCASPQAVTGLNRHWA
ncbi:hypothetical protein ACLOJK_027842 [Asimina triloba]